MSFTIRRCLTLVLCGSLVFPLLAHKAAAQNKTEVTITIGRPNIWSLAQAHYLLANMRQTNRGLQVAGPGQLNPNSINGARLDVLRTLLGIEAQFSTPQALQNSVAQQQFAADFARKQSAIARLDELSREHLQAIREISDLEIELAKLGSQPSQDKQNEETEKRRQELTAQRAAKLQLRDAIAGQITTVSTQTNAAASLSNLQNTMPFGAPSSGSLPADGLGDLKTLVTSMLGQNAIPDADASQKLDNYIEMQYEVIAKQLTLLRDEVGPDERLVFLELPSSLYTVPKRDDDQVVQIEWKVAEYFGWCPGTRSRSVLRSKSEIEAQNRIERVADLDTNGGMPKSDQPPPITDDLLQRFEQVRGFQNLLPELSFFENFERLRNSKGQPEKEQFTALNTGANQARIEGFRRLGQTTLQAVRDLREILDWYPQLKDMGWVLAPGAFKQNRVARCEQEVDSKSHVRVIDIIPRQSSLNVNEAHATQKGFALTAKFLTLFGFGGQVSYQRQRSIYEQFINQDVFASGFGKGTDRFGWTMGPLPGTKRLAPGPRTTFAILAVPSHAWQINLQATAIAFPRTKSPTNPNDAQYQKALTPVGIPASFDITVPNENTEGFWIDSINYTPVRKGDRVTAILSGRYFSPLTGVMVDGIPLKRAVAIAKHESDTTTLPLAADSPGEYEYLNSNQIIISFKTADANFVGTPLITLVTPEKTASINFFTDLRINFRFTNSLQLHSLIEPMFMDDVNLTALEVDKKYLDDSVYLPGSPISVRLTGGGFRRRAEICLNNSCKTDPPLTNTGLIEIELPKPKGRIWTITYRLGQRTVSKSFDTLTDGMKLDAPTITSIENPSTNRAEGLIGGGYTVIIRGSNLQNVNHVSFGSKPAKIISPSPQHPNVLFVEVPPGQEGGVQVLLKGKIPAVPGQPEAIPPVPAQPEKPVSNILDFMTPGNAIFKYLKPPEKPAETKPTQPSPTEKKPKRKSARQRVTESMPKLAN